MARRRSEESEIAELNALVGDSGRVLVPVPDEDYFSQFDAVVRQIRDLLTGDYLRPGGLTVYPTGVPADHDVLADLLENVELEKRRHREFFFPSRLREGTFYHVCSLIDYLIARYVGWIDPLDREWLRVDKAGRAPLGWTGAYGYSLTPLLSEAYSYFEGIDPFVLDLFSLAGRELPAEIAELLPRAVVVRYEAFYLRASFPEAKMFWQGTEDNEICCPMFPPTVDSAGRRVLAVMEWNSRTHPLPEET